MIAIALVDNGSLEPAATLNLRRVAQEISAQSGTSVAPVSWKHSDRINPAALESIPAEVIASWLEKKLYAGTREFLFLPFFISAQGAIGSALRTTIEEILSRFPDTRVGFADGVAYGDWLTRIVVARVEGIAASSATTAPTVIVVDHGGPSVTSAELRNTVARQIGGALGSSAARVIPASMEGEAYPHAHPLLAEVLRAPEISLGPVVIALLFLSPGRHAGNEGDIAQIVASARREKPELDCHTTGLVGTHPLMTECLVDSLRRALSAFSSFGSA